ncbi:hypothetical protein BJF90_20645 [Pseudonocardia sp. CNS-004]|nr:hypothetical protein BJF90_20645 [Pseudonocardia sp. CNS-004]
MVEAEQVRQLLGVDLALLQLLDEHELPVDQRLAAAGQVDVHRVDVVLQGGLLRGEPDRLLVHCVEGAGDLADLLAGGDRHRGDVDARRGAWRIRRTASGNRSCATVMALRRRVRSDAIMPRATRPTMTAASTSASRRATALIHATTSALCRCSATAAPSSARRPSAAASSSPRKRLYTSPTVTTPLPGSGVPASTDWTRLLRALLPDPGISPAYRTRWAASSDTRKSARPLSRRALLNWRSPPSAGDRPLRTDTTIWACCSVASLRAAPRPASALARPVTSEVLTLRSSAMSSCTSCSISSE